MVDRRRNGSDYFWDLLLILGTAGAAWFLTRNVISTLQGTLADPDKEKREQARLKAKANLQRLQKSREYEEEGIEEEDSNNETKRGPRIEDLVLNEYENLVALEVVPPEDIPVGFDDIGGLEDIIEEVKESVIYPLTMPHLYSHAAPLLSAPSGVLLYGPPGCGKTMLAKAVAHESGASFINLHISTLTEKWYGDSNKLVRAVFSLARKLQPAIIFIDEIDAVLGTRRSGEHEASGMVKAEFMTLWDGLTSANTQGLPARIVVLGATNRIHDIDEAILRRMPKKFPVSLPDKNQRLRILQLVLKDTKTDPNNFNIEYVARVTAGMSGSDIKEACRDAAMAPVREYIRQHRASGSSMSAIDPSKVRGIRTEDFFGRKGAGQILMKNHARAKSSSDEYEDVEDDAETVETSTTGAKTAEAATEIPFGRREVLFSSRHSTMDDSKPLNKAVSKVDIDGHTLPPSPAPSSPSNGRRRYALATELVYTETKDQYGASSIPVYQSATFKQTSSKGGDEYDYTRSGNPTRTHLERHMAKIMNANRALAVGSGMGALDVITRLLRPGDEVITGDDLYGGTNRLLTYLSSNQGIVVHHVDTTEVERVREVVSDKTSMVLLETPTNPLIKIVDIPSIAKAVHDANSKALVIVDNTMLSPMLCNPLELGADIVYESGTKYLSGHHDIMAGVIACNDTSLGDKMYFTINATGCGLSPNDSFLLMRGVKTLAIRMEKQQANAQVLAEFLESHGFRVRYPGLKSHPQYDLHWSMARGAGAVLSFETGDVALSERIVEAAKLYGISVSFGCVNSLISMPCRMSHASIDAKTRKERQMPEDIIRLCVGIEDVHDLVDDLSRALVQAGAVTITLDGFHAVGATAQVGSTISSNDTSSEPTLS
ncbi:Cystathionine beta-lyase [Daldinia childiae]|uniref:Cystathionine beta-lyase n=1 Tax=Daldinia childiae TaxID=326645 RepID=UPI001446FCC8|nr:Cystathionine beta-lyase [Daldinia childiae]KAF3061362.1 Cystathionine beta-lyase [Daldinia childiae]